MATPKVVGGLLVCAHLQWAALGQITNIQVRAEADAFVREAAPDDNYGRAGNLSVAGKSALDGFGKFGGRVESLARFRINDVVASLDEFYGDHEWFIAEAFLQVYEMADPNNPIFGRGPGKFEIQWLSSGDSWDEGTGSPNAPTADGLAYKDMASLFDPSQDLPLGVFTSKSVDGSLTFALDLPVPFTDDLRSGDPVTIRFLPLDDLIGFTFLSRSDRRPEWQMTLNLKISDGPAPRITSISRIDATTVNIAFVNKAQWVTALQSFDSSGSSGALWQTLLLAPANDQEKTFSLVESSTNKMQLYRLAAYPP